MWWKSIHYYCKNELEKPKARGPLIASGFLTTLLAVIACCSLFLFLFLFFLASCLYQNQNKMIRSKNAYSDCTIREKPLHTFSFITYAGCRIQPGSIKVRTFWVQDFWRVWRGEREVQAPLAERFQLGSSCVLLFNSHLHWIWVDRGLRHGYRFGGWELMRQTAGKEEPSLGLITLF